MPSHPWARWGLVRHPGQRDRFALTDNLTGWFEGFTHSRTLGQGYMVRDEFVFRGWSSTVNGRPLDRDFKAHSDTVFPWGHTLEYEGVTEELLLHSGRRILSLRVTTGLPSTLDLVPKWLAPFPKELKRGTVVRRTPTSLTVHLVFGETDEEFRDNQAAAKCADLWDSEVERRWASLNETWLRTDDEAYNMALFWAQASARSLITTEFGTGQWAGLPWFKDNWGRDTFIALPGTLLVTGQFKQARAVLENFARYQNLDDEDRNFGRIPNRVTTQEILYNTVDGTPWMIRELWEYAQYSGDAAFAQSLRPLVRRYVDGALRNYVDADGLLCHDDADTWMDARIAGDTPWTPRGNRAVEIQVLWITALTVGALLAGADGGAANGAEESALYTRLAGQAAASFQRLFLHPAGLWDRLAADGTPDASLRPNALMAVTIPFAPLLTDPVRHRMVADTTAGLLLPQGILSLAPDHPDFHPRHENPVFWHKDAAYHNGTIWGWNAGFTIGALAACGWQNKAWQVTVNLTQQILTLGTLGTMSELLDATPDPDGRLVPTGTFSQAWSVSEFARNAYQDYLGYRPEVLAGRLVFVPHLPTAWTRVEAHLRFGTRSFDVFVHQTCEGQVGQQAWSFWTSASLPAVTLDGQIHAWKDGRVVFDRTVALPADEPSWATLPLTAGSVVLSGPDVLNNQRLPKSSVDG